MSIQSAIEQKLGALNPQFLNVENESHKHNVPEGSESHFRVTVVSEQFDGKMLVARHRLVNQILNQELADSVHALALHTMTPDEWFEKVGTAAESPPCLGGSADQKN